MKHYELFYGDGCGSCEEVRLIVAQNSFKLGFEYTEFEVWNNKENQHYMDTVISKSYTTVPIILDTTSKRIWNDQESLIVWLKS